MKKTYKIIGFIILILGAISMLLPFIYMISLSFMTDKQIISGTTEFIAHPSTFEHYKYVVNNVDIIKYFYHSYLKNKIKKRYANEKNNEFDRI